MSIKNFYDVTQMNSCAGELHSLGPDTEPEFLDIGGTLNNLAGFCFSMTDDALQLASLANFSVEDDVSDEDSFIDETKNIFDEIASHVKQTINSFNEGEYLLSDLLSQVKKLRDPIQSLYNIGKTFHVLGTRFEIESSRNQCKTEGFSLLAQEIADIALLIGENCRYCIDKTVVIEGDISSTKQVLNSNDNKYDSRGEEAIQRIFNALKNVGSKSEILAAGIKERSDAMVQGISDVVMAMQFHDISRQQLENVAKALVEINEKVESADDEMSSEEDEQIVLEVYGILSIQVAHLNSIYEQVFNARREIEAGLRKTMEQAQEQAGDARSMLEMDVKGGGRSVVDNLEEEIDNIATSLNKSLEVVGHAADVSKNVSDNVSEMGSFVTKIEAIAFDVKFLAINAMVEVVKTGDTDSTLTVLAKKLSKLSHETRSGATHSIEKLQEIITNTEKQLEFSTSLSENRGVVDIMIKRAKTLTGIILSSIQGVSAIAQKMDSVSLDLASQITRLIPGIKFPGIMGDRIDQNWMIICQIVNRIEEEYPQFLEKSVEVKEMLEKIAHGYVMNRERSIHAQVAGEKSEADADLADVDLFDDDGFELFDNDSD